MIKVNVEVDFKPWFKKIKTPKKYFNKKLKKIKKIIPFFKNKNITFTILLTNSTRMKSLNKKFRNKKQSTDVLSFPSILAKNLKLIKENNIYIGDVAACYQIINQRAKKNNFIEEFDKIWIHGLLHLIGHDHIKNKDHRKMVKLENKILNSITK